MSKFSKPKTVDRQMDDNIVQFCGVTGASVKDAKRFLGTYKRVDIAIDAFYNDASSVAATARRHETITAPSTSKLNLLFDNYKDPDGPDITIDGTLNLCKDLAVDPEDVVMLAVAYELKSPRVGEWNRKTWTDGWKNLGCDSIPEMKTALMKLRDKLGSDPKYFQQVYNHTFDFARVDGQRSIVLEVAQAFWALLLPAGLQGGALAHIQSKDLDDDIDMGKEEGWADEYVQWWFEFLNEKGCKGVSKDTWMMFLEFVRTIDSRFECYDMEAAWPSTIDDFVVWAKKRLVSQS